MESFKNIIRTYRQKFTNVAAEIYKVSFNIFYLLTLQLSYFNIFHQIKVLAKRYKHQCEELQNILSTERSSWQTKLDELQQGGSKTFIDPYERNKLIEQGRHEQKIETESLISELKAKVNI